MKKTRLVAALVSSSLVALGFVAPASAVGATLYVASSGTAGAGSSCETAAYIGGEGLKSAIAVAASGSNIQICGSSSDTFTVTGTTIQITKALTIAGTLYGRGPNIASAMGNSLFEINTANDSDVVSFQGVVISDADTSNSPNVTGSAIALTKGRLEMNRVVVRNFKSRGLGTIALKGQDPNGLDLSSVRTVISNSAFTNNSAGVGGAIYLVDGATASLDNVTIANNSAVTATGLISQTGLNDSGQGSAIFAPNIDPLVPGYIKVNHTTFYDNAATDGSSVLYGANIELKNSIVAQRLAVGKTCSDVFSNGGNLFTDKNCGTTTRFYTGLKDEDAIARISQLRLGHLATYLNRLPYVALMPGSVAIDFLSSAQSTMTNDINDTQRGDGSNGNTPDVGSFEYRYDPDFEMTVNISGYIRGDDNTASVDGSRVGESGYTIRTRKFTVSTTSGNPLVTYTSLTPSLCTITDSSGLQSNNLEDIKFATNVNSTGVCIVEAFAKTSTFDWTAFIEVKLYYGTAPGAPRNVVMYPGETTLTVNFAEPSDDGGPNISGYRLRLTGPSSFDQTYNCVLTPKLSCAVTGLTTSTLYTAYMFVDSEGGTHKSFGIGSIKTSQLSPAKVRSLKVISPAKAQIKATWTTPLTPGMSKLTSYRVLVFLYGAKTPLKTISLKTSVRTTLVKGLKSKKKYLIRVLAYNEDGYVSITDKTITTK